MKRKLAIIGLCLAAAALFVFSLPTLLGAYARLLVLPDATQKADLMIVLGGEPKARAPAAIAAYRRGLAPIALLVTDREPSGLYPDILFLGTKQMSMVFERENVPFLIMPSRKNGVTSTLDEAWDSADFIKRNFPEAKRIILVTTHYHTRRARYAFRKVFARAGLGDIAIETFSANDNSYDIDRWYKSERGISNVIMESAKWILYPFIDENPTIVEEG